MVHLRLCAPKKRGSKPAACATSFTAALNSATDKGALENGLRKRKSLSAAGSLTNKASSSATGSRILPPGKNCTGVDASGATPAKEVRFASLMSTDLPPSAMCFTILLVGTHWNSNRLLSCLQVSQPLSKPEKETVRHARMF